MYDAPIIIGNIYDILANKFYNIGQCWLRVARYHVLAVGVVHRLQMRVRAVVFHMICKSHVSFVAIAPGFDDLTIRRAKIIREAKPDAQKTENQQCRSPQNTFIALAHALELNWWSTNLERLLKSVRFQKSFPHTYLHRLLFQPVLPPFRCRITEFFL